MPSSEVMHKFKAGKLHSGSKKGKLVTNPKQAVAILISEQKAEQAGTLDRPKRSSYRRRG